MDKTPVSKPQSTFTAAPAKPLIQSRPFTETTGKSPTPASLSPEEVQAKIDRLSRAGDLTRMKFNSSSASASSSVSAPEPSVAQRQPETESEPSRPPELLRSWLMPHPVQPPTPPSKPRSPDLPRRGIDLTQLKFNSSSALQSKLQRQEASPESSDGELQTKLLQRQAETSEDNSEEEVENVQTQPIQTKLTIGAPGDRYEQEADAVADKVMAMPEPALQTQTASHPERDEEERDQLQMKPLAAEITPLVQREAIEEEESVQARAIQREAVPEEESVQMLPVQRESMKEEEIQTKPLAAVQREAVPEEEPIQAKAISTLRNSEGTAILPRLHNKDIQRKSAAPAPTADLESQLAAQKGGGSPLSDEVRSFMEPRFSTDFSQVRVHTDSSAIQMNKDLRAQAFTHGSDIYFGSGKSPGNNDLTAHELTHVVQQTGTKRLQRQAVGAVKIARKTGHPSISRTVEGILQRKPAPKSAQADPDFQRVVGKTKEVAKQQKAHPPAKTKANEAQAAAVPPPNEKESKAQDRQVQEMNQQQPGQFDAAKFKAALMQKISAAAPSTLEEADKFKDGKQLEGVKRDAAGQVGNEKKQAAAGIEDKTKEPPKTGGIPEKPVTPLPPQQAASPPGDVGAAQAVPKPKDASEVSMAEGSKSLDQQMASANVTEEQIEKSNEPEFKGALGAKKEAQAHAAIAPQEYRQQEQATIAQAQTQAQATAKAPLQGMQSQKNQALSQVAGLQGGTKGQDEQKRAEVSNHIQTLYNNTKQKVETLLGELDKEVNQEFDRGANAAKQAFDGYVNQRMQRFREERYSGVDGAARWVWDKITSPPPEVNGFYAEGRKLYLQSMDSTLDRLANLVSTKLNAAKTEISNGRQEIQKYVAGLDPSLKQFGQQAAQDIASKFDALEQNVDNKQNELIDSLAQKYNEKLQELDAEIEKKKEENKGLLDKAKDALGETIKTILELKNMLMGMLAKAAGAVEKIIKDPIGFLGNLVAGIKQGFMGFVGNITEHLKKGLIGWLTGALAGAGIEMPKSFDLKGIFALVTGLLGLTYQGIRGRVANKVGEKKVSALEKGFDMFILWKNEGAAGLWKFIQDKLTNLKEMVMGGIQSFVIDSIINAGVTWVLSLLNPASAFVRACKLIIDVIMFFVERGSQIAELVNAVLDSVNSIADGAIGIAAKLVEGALGKALPVVIGFLASLIGLGGISGKIRSLIEKARGLIDKAIDWVMSKAIAFVKKIGKAFGFGKEKEENKGQKEKLDIPDGPIGSPTTFNARGEGHRLWVELKGGKSIVMVASAQEQASNKLQSISSQIQSLPKEERVRAQALVETGFSLLNQTQQVANEQVETIENTVSLKDVNAAKAKINQRISSINERYRLAHIFQELFEILFNATHQDGNKREVDKSGNVILGEKYDAKYATEYYVRELNSAIPPRGVPMIDAHGKTVRVVSNGIERDKRHERPFTVATVVDEQTHKAHFGMSAAQENPEINWRKGNRHEQMDVAYSNLDKVRSDGSSGEVESHSRANCAEHECFDKAFHTRQQHGYSETGTPFKGLTDDSAYGRTSTYRHKDRCDNCKIMYPEKDQK